MTHTISALIAAISVCISGFAICAETSASDPAEIVREMFEALKAEDWKKAANCIDIKGIVEEAREYLQEAIKGLEEDERLKAEKELGELTEEKVRLNFIENMREVFGSDFTYEIVETKMQGDENAVVSVELSRKEKSRTDAIPVAKIDGKWKISFRNLVQVRKPE